MDNANKGKKISLRSTDVLCGRGGRGSKQFEHPGSKAFRSIVASNKVNYPLISFKKLKLTTTIA